MSHKEKILKPLFLLSLCVLLLSFTCCENVTANETPSSPGTSNNTGSGKYITVNFNYNDVFRSEQYSNIYVIWLENSAGVIQHLYVCNRLLNYIEGTTNYITNHESALPFWHLNSYDDTDVELVAEVDAVTAATLAEQSFSLSNIEIDEDLGNDFKIYFEVDQSFEYQTNGAFPGAGHQMTDQPAVLYSADINLTGSTDYTLDPIGFTPMYVYDNYVNATTPMVLTTADQTLVDAGTLIFDKGILFEEMRYITHDLTTNVAGDTIFGTEYSFYETDGDDNTDNESSIRCITSIEAVITD